MGPREGPISVQSAAAFAHPSQVPILLKRWCHALWFGRSVRAQLLLAFVLIDVVAVVVAGSVVILRARMQTRVEMAASLRLADLLVEDAVHLAGQELPAEQFLASLPAQLQSMRHVRFVVSDAAGSPIAAKSPGRARAENDATPRWFTALVAPPVETRDVAVTVDGQQIGRVAIIGEPADEIAEVWDNAVAMAAVAVLLNVVMIGLLYILFGRVLGPLTVLAHGLSDLEHQTYGVRLPQPQARELAAIAEHFNALALALEALRAENLNLNRRLITAQDDERRRTARELHDEVGPCLFGLKANASSIATAAQNLPEQARHSVVERLRDILGIIDHLQSINRSMLDRLRPMALGHVPLKDMLARLVSERAREHPHIAFSLAAGDLRRSYGDSIDLTVYRCIQESVTNAIRHAVAKHVAVTLDHIEQGTALALTVADDGRGMSESTPEGFGTRGMKERVEGLGGRYRIDSEHGRGTRVRITIPLAEGSANL
jgi:two-component system sensor histidine kinase UhpB